MVDRSAGTVKVIGAKELRSSMKRAELDLRDLKEAHASAALIVARRGSELAPRVTGALATSVRGSAGATVATVRGGTARVPYANPIHWGWAARNIAPNPFLSEAAQTTEDAWTRMYLAATERALDKVKGA